MSSPDRLTSLDEWRLREGLTYRALAELIGDGCSVNLAYAYCLDPDAAEFRMPRPKRQRRIFQVTNGQVRPDSFYKLPKLTRPFDRNAPELALPAPAKAAA